MPVGRTRFSISAACVVSVLAFLGVFLLVSVKPGLWGSIKLVGMPRDWSAMRAIARRAYNRLVKRHRLTSVGQAD